MFLFNLYRTIRFVNYSIYNTMTNIFTKFMFKLNRIKYSPEGFFSKGKPNISIHHTAKVTIGKNFKINNTIMSNPIGGKEKCLLIVRENSTLVIGNNVGISGTTIVAQKEIIIEDNVKIGGNVRIYDTDFHSLEADKRKIANRDKEHTVKKRVLLRKNSFIGAHTTILKGVEVGENSIIGACSVIAKDIPKNEVWAGNPARFIKKIDQPINGKSI